MKKTSVWKKHIKSLRWWILLLTSDYLLLESCHQYIIAKYKASDCGLDQISQTCFFYSSQWNRQNFCSSYFWLHLIVSAHLHCDKVAVKHNVTEKYLWRSPFILQLKLQNVSIVGSGCFWVVFWNCFLNDVSVKNRSLFVFYKKKTVWPLDVRSHVTKDLSEIRVYFNISPLRI